MGLDVEGYTLSDEDIRKWKAATDLEPGESYDEWYEWAYDPATNTWIDLPGWALDGNSATGPFDIDLNASLDWHDE